MSKDPKKAKVDDAIRNGFDWLIRVISESYDILHRRVEEDIRLRDETEKRERAERKARVEKLRQEYVAKAKQRNLIILRKKNS